MRKAVLMAGIAVGVVVLVVVGVNLLPGGWAGVISKIYFGAGLKPRTELRFEVQVQDAVNDEADLAISRLHAELQKAQLENVVFERNVPSSVDRADSIQIDIKGVAASRAADLRSISSASLPGWNLTPVDGTSYRLNPNPSELATWKRLAVQQTVAAVQKRVLALGLVGNVVRSSAPFEITVQLAGTPLDPTRLKQLLSSRSRLELVLVTDGPYPDWEQALAAHGGSVSFDIRVTPNAPTSSDTAAWWVLTRWPVITGSDLKSARPSQDEGRRWNVAFKLTPDAARRFGAFTESHIGRRLAIVLDNRVLSAPIIQTRVEDSGIISGMDDEQRASELATVLNAGALPASLSERTAE